jgi:hypothetical protein
MATSSILGADRAPSQATGRDVEALGPSDTSDSGSDIQGSIELADPSDTDQPIFGTAQPGLDSDSDSAGTGERGSALVDEGARDAADILPDRVRSLAGEATSGLTETELDELETTGELDDLAQDAPSDESDDDAGLDAEVD